jgi:hypothetical protein
MTRLRHYHPGVLPAAAPAAQAALSRAAAAAAAATAPSRVGGGGQCVEVSAGGVLGRRGEAASSAACWRLEAQTGCSENVPQLCLQLCPHFAVPADPALAERRRKAKPASHVTAPSGAWRQQQQAARGS